MYATGFRSAKKGSAYEDKLIEEFEANLDRFYGKRKALHVQLIQNQKRKICCMQDTIVGLIGEKASFVKKNM